VGRDVAGGGVEELVVRVEVLAEVPGAVPTFWSQAEKTFCSFPFFWKSMAPGDRSPSSSSMSPLERTLWLCAYCPVSTEARPGQHSGVEAKLLRNVVPFAPSSFWILGMQARVSAR
jgi:hypothetical protein